MGVENTDITKRISLKSNGEKVSVPSLHEMFVYLYTMESYRKKLVATFKKSATDQFAITIDPDDDSRFIVVFNRNLNKNVLGQVYVEVATQTTADSKYPDSLKNDAKTGVKFDFIESSADSNGL